MMSTMELAPLPTTAVTSVDQADTLVYWILAFANHCKPSGSIARALAWSCHYWIFD